jgi:hypothetical protein
MTKFNTERFIIQVKYTGFLSKKAAKALKMETIYSPETMVSNLKVHVELQPRRPTQTFSPP